MTTTNSNHPSITKDNPYLDVDQTFEYGLAPQCFRLRFLTSLEMAQAGVFPTSMLSGWFWMPACFDHKEDIDENEWVLVPLNPDVFPEIWQAIGLKPIRCIMFGVPMWSLRGPDGKPFPFVRAGVAFGRPENVEENEVPRTDH